VKTVPSPIEDYALIGDCQTAALVSKEGSIDWLCWPRFDSAACFAGLLGSPENGRWLIAPASPHGKVTRRYCEHTLVLETEFETTDGAGAVTVIDFMPPTGRHSHVVRMVRGRRGKVAMRMALTLRFDYGRSVPWVTRMEDGSMRAIAGPNMVVLRTPAPLRGENMHTVSEFVVDEGATIPFVLTYRASHHDLPEAIDPETALDQTQAFWRNWTSRCTYKGPWADAVERSLITLKALTYQPTGGIVAAPTTSLPERPGGARNWDYRFCWLRDATFALVALISSGYFEEAADWQNWLLRAVAGSPDQVQILYGLGGERQLTELELGWLPGYANSKPVRIGNAASEQLQLDIYGEIAGMLHYGQKSGLPRNEPGAALLGKFLEHLENIWREADQGIWEVRGPRRHFTHSKVMAWLAFDRAVQSCLQFGLDGPVERWRAVRDQIHDDICRQGFDADLGSFVQSYGSKELDASLLLMPLIGFLLPSDPRIIGTVRAIERHLIRDGLVMRYNTHEVDDGLTPGEGAFLPCSFWLASVYHLSGRHTEAQQLFERLLSLRNDVGLLSEEYDLVGRRLVGNFPQAFSHLALINAAFRFSRMTESPAKTRDASVR
jgi:GH15 family glucan-1,4-alpha-glucosidase